MPALPESNRTQHNKFVELDVLRDADGLKAIISQRRDTGVVTFAIMREFQRGSEAPNTTSFIPETLVDSFSTMVDRVRDRIDEIRRQGLAPRAERPSRQG